jgi:hypothetical protein
MLVEDRRTCFPELRILFIRLQNYFMRHLYSLASEITSLMEKKFCLIKDGCPFLDNLSPSSGNLSPSVSFLLPKNWKRPSRVSEIRNKIFIKFNRKFQWDPTTKFFAAFQILKNIKLALDWTNIRQPVDVFN